MNDIVIVGGGTSGWMAAIALSSHFPDKHITVIDPTSIAPIGVGESVTGVVLGFVRYPFHGLNLTDFYRHSDATLKLGVWYKDWQGAGTEYLSPIDFPPDVFDHHYYQDLEDFYAQMTAAGLSVGEEQIHGRLMRAGRTDYFRRPDGTISGQLATASCHFDALKFAAWLKSVALTRQNITHVDDMIRGFDQDAETGIVREVVTEQDRHVGGDFFLDCTGFRRLLFQPAYSPQWVDYSKFIKVDSAMPSFAPHVPGKPMPVCTVAQALPHGWLWRIPTQSRLGSGYVYSSKYVSDEQAIEEQRAAGVDVGDSPRIIRFQPGKFATQWEGNVCAIGLAGGFIEPLESTTIHIMHVQIKALTELLLPYYSHDARHALANKYNRLIAAMYDDFVDFVSFHYRAGRSDTEFWRDYQRDDANSPANNARRDTWRFAYPSREDFVGFVTDRFVLTTGLLVWMPMLGGMGHLNRHAAAEVVRRTRFRREAQTNLAKYVQVRDFLSANGVTQNEAVKHLRGGESAQPDTGSQASS